MEDGSITVPDGFKHLVKPDTLRGKHQDYQARKKQIIQYCTDVEHTKEQIEHYMGYKPGSSGVVLRELRKEHKLFMPAKGRYKAIEVDHAIKEKADTAKKAEQLRKLDTLFKQFMWEEVSADWWTLTKLKKYIDESL